MVTIIIPSRNELFLNQTIRDVLAKSEGEIEVLPILDGWEPEDLIYDVRVRYIRLPKNTRTQKRHGINQAVKEAKGEYVMWIDAHVMLAQGWDKVLVRDHKPNWVQIPRRHRLDAENWCLQDQVDSRPPIDYEYWMWPLKFNPKALHGFKWDQRSRERADVMIDDSLTFQASLVFMTKEYFNKLGLMQTEGYTGWGQEAEEVGLKVRLDGGEIKVNKNTWYAHLHKGAKYGRMYWMSREDNRKCYEYAYQQFVYENKDLFIKLIEKFWPIPGWPQDWKQQLYGKEEI